MASSNALKTQGSDDRVGGVWGGLPRRLDNIDDDDNDDDVAPPVFPVIALLI
jgi:hypothetical protein